MSTTIIDNTLPVNNKLTTRKLYRILVEAYPEPTSNISLSTVKRTTYELGWVVRFPKLCQMIWIANKEKQLVWCERMKRENEQFDDVVFTDESSVVLDTQKEVLQEKGYTPQAETKAKVSC